MLTTANWKARKADDILSQTEQPPLFWDDDEPNGSAADGSESCSTDSTDNTESTASTESVTEPADGQGSEPEPEQEQSQSQPLIRPLMLKGEQEEDDDCDDDVTVLREGQIPLPDVTDYDVSVAIRGTLFGSITQLFSSVTVPELPIGGAIVKTLSVLGCALSGCKYNSDLMDNVKQIEKDEKTGDTRSVQTEWGRLAARVLISTGTGQVPNVYALLIAPPASGKDIGGILPAYCRRKGWYIGSGGSAEGIAQALLEAPNGMLQISEMEKFMDVHSWQNKAVPFLVTAFSDGFIQEQFSGRGRGKGPQTFTVPYTYPSIMGNIQPDVFSTVISQKELANGFMSRFLIARMNYYEYTPAKLDLTERLNTLDNLVLPFERMKGRLDFPENYTERFARYRDSIPENMLPTWRRLINEYYPRFALMLSLKSQGIDTYRDIRLENLRIDDDTMDRAETLTLWFYMNALRAISGMAGSSAALKIRKFMQGVINIVRRLEANGKDITRSLIYNRVYIGTDVSDMKSWRDSYFNEMVSRGILRVIRGDEVLSLSYTSDNYTYMYGDRFKLGKVPPEFA